MWILWLAPLFLASAVSPQTSEKHRYVLGAGHTGVMNCDGEFECFENLVGCASLMKHYDLDDKKNVKLKELLIYGHNGLRNRLARKLNVCDMLAMTWDSNLAILASRHHLNCSRYLFCDVQEGRIISNKDMLRLYKPVAQGNSTDVARNSFFRNNIYVRNFLEYALAMWYETHIELKPPKETQYMSNKYYKINGDNSFTHMIRPNAHKLGCSYAMFNDGLSLICYYFPYLHTNKTILLRRKPKEYQCPYSFPILHPYFKSLCKYAKY